MVKVLDLKRQVLLGVAIALLVASMLLIPQHRVLGDDGVDGQPVALLCSVFASYPKCDGYCLIGKCSPFIRPEDNYKYCKCKF